MNKVVTYQEELREILLTMNELLSKHVEIHDKVFKRGLLSIFKRIPFQEYAREGSRIQSDIKVLQSNLSLIEMDGTKEDIRIVNVIKDYLSRFAESVNKLTQITKSLTNKANGVDFSYKEYNALTEEYNECEQYRLLLGDKMNSVGRELLN
ncbi:hypothetical protein ACJROX_10875 [Pseudalkalibacillus sp. A8]|uniref:hypothetical protein n=1 Tax=Pseudalkalibacillus sp. A8 TaxID=3382641 RepID=UPI0038B67CF6